MENNVDLEKMQVELLTGKPPSDTSYEANLLRDQLQKEIDEIKAKGGHIDIPSEIAG